MLIPTTLVQHSTKRPSQHNMAIKENKRYTIWKGGNNAVPSPDDIITYIENPKESKTSNIKQPLKSISELQHQGHREQEQHTEINLLRC